MLRRATMLAVLLASAGLAHALTLDGPRVDVTLIGGSTKDPFRIRGRLAGADLDAVAAGPVTIRFGDVRASIPAGALRRRGRTFKWRSYLLGVKKVTINARKSTIDVVGGGLELGDLPGPVTLGIGTAHGVTCNRVVWTNEIVLARGRGGRRARKVAVGPFAPCLPPRDGADHTPPHVLITTPTPLDGTTTATPTITLGGSAIDEFGVAGLSWSNDRGGGASVVADAAWTVADIPLADGDNRITVTATDAAGNTGSDVVTVTYNVNGIVFDGMPIAVPDALFTGTTVHIAVRQGILPNPDLDTLTVQLEQVADDGSTTPVATLRDDGVLAGGDKIQGDGIYTGEERIIATEVGVSRYRVSARLLSQPASVAWSPIVVVPTVEHLTQQDLDAAVLFANNARALFTGLSEDGATTDEAIAEVVALANVDGARAAGASAGGLGAWWVTEQGILGGMLAYDTTARRGGVAPNAPRAATGPRVVRNPAPPPPSPLLQVGTRRSLILAPYFEDEEPFAIDGMLRGSQCPLFQVQTFTGTDASAERFKNLENYGVIVVASHGDTLFDGVGDAYRPEWAWNSSGAQTVVLTGTTLTLQNRADYERDLRLGRMAVFPDAVAAVLPNFITRYSIRLPSSLVYVGSCRSSASETLAAALFERGAVTYVGYDGYVASSFASDVGTDLFANLLAGKSTLDSITPGLTDGGTPPASLVALGRTDASLTADPVVNGSFEITSGFEASVTGFTVTGDGRIVGSLGVTLPTEGRRMALVSTGLGLTTTSGTFSQPVCMPPLPPGATKLMLYYDWNFFSEEFIEYCGSQFQDSFEVSFGGTSLQSTKIDDVCGIVTPADVSFDQGGVYKTGWITQAVDVTAYAGQTADLKFGAKDVGDSIFDSAILVDNVRVVAE